jgi:hypothetical protein
MLGYKSRRRCGEMADTRDLKSLAQKRVGSSPTVATRFLIDLMRN